MNQIPKATAYWISPYNEILPIEDRKHIDDVVEHPKNFGFTVDELKEIFDKHNEKWGSEGNAREEIIKNLIQKNWIRIRKYERPDRYTVNVRELNNRTKDILSKWASSMAEQGSKYSDVYIDTPRERIHYSMDKIASDVLYKEDEKHEEAQFVIVKSAAEFGKSLSTNLNKYLESVCEQEEIWIYNESSWSRIWQHITDLKTDFGVISAFQKDESRDKNEENHKQLKKDVQQLGYGFTEQKSGYTYLDKEKTVEEKSLFITRIKFDEALSLGKKHNQETILYKDKNVFGLYNTKNGKKIMTFAKKGKIFSMNGEDLKNAYSQLIKANQAQKNIKISFIAEHYIPSRTDGLIALKTKIRPSEKWVDLISRKTIL